MNAPATTETPKKRSVALSKAQKAYYERNRDKRLEEMRERAKARNEAEKLACENNPELLKERRAMFLEKYYKYQMADTAKRIKMWREDPGICNTFKEFLKENVEPVKTLLPRKFFNTLSKLSIAVKPQPEVPTTTIVDNADTTHYTSAEHYAYSQADRDF
jgi:hypothetical protein